MTIIDNNNLVWYSMIPDIGRKIVLCQSFKG